MIFPKQPASPNAPQSSLRVELLGQLSGAQMAVEAAITELRRSGDGSLLAQGERQLQSLQALQAALATASPTALISMRAEVLASITTAGTTVQQARVAGSQQSAEMASLAAVRAESHQLAEATQRALFEDRILDASLRFASPAEEEAYRQREAERLALIDSLDPRSPRSARDQLLIQRDQVDDAMAHGADRDPRAQQMRDQIDRQLRLQREAEIRAGRDPKEYDREVAALQASLLPRASAQAEEKAAYVARRWKTDASGAAEDDSVTNAVSAMPRGAKAEVLAAAVQAASAIDSSFQEDAPAAMPVQQVAGQLRAAGVAGTPASDGEPMAPARVGSPPGQTGRSGPG